MSKIIWEGNQEWNKEFKDEPIPANATKIGRADDIVKASIPYMILPCIICCFVVFRKRIIADTFLFDLRFIPISVIVSFLVGIPIHEYLHAVCYPSEAVVYVGVCLKKLRAYAVSFYPITKARFIVMSLAPTIPGIITLFIFIVAPVEARIVNTICMFPMYMSLLSPAPDYMDIISVIKQVPKGAKIQASNHGLFWFN